MIYPIAPTDLQDDFLREYFYSDLDRTFYWSDFWDPTFYIALARAGFISISYCSPEHGTLLLPELQERYAVLDWENLHISSQARRRMASITFDNEIELRIGRDHSLALDRILEYHGRSTTWLSEPYCDLLGRLSSETTGDFRLHGVELWSRKRDFLVAGEIGYSFGRTYTSLSGFCTRDDPEWDGFGTLQMILLAQRLEERGFAFWNMGHPSPPYKRALGARLLERSVFLERWLVAKDETSEQPLI